MREQCLHVADLERRRRLEKPMRLLLETALLRVARITQKRRQCRLRRSVLVHEILVQIPREHAMQLREVRRAQLGHRLQSGYDVSTKKRSARSSHFRTTTARSQGTPS